MHSAFAPLAVIIVMISAILAGELSAPKTVRQAAFPVVGIEARTSNAKEGTGDGVIGKQWQKFFQDGVLEKIPNKVDGNTYAVYSDYASDKNGEYSLTIGAKVRDGSPAPPGLVLKTVTAGNYTVVTSEKGPVAKVVVAAWQRVWAMEDRRELAPRAYKTDYELYDQRAADPENSQADLYIGTK